MRNTGKACRGAGERLTEMVKARRAIVVMGLVGLVLVGGCKKDTTDNDTTGNDAENANPTKKNPLVMEFPTYVYCADSTAYMIDEDGVIVWLVGGKAVPVELPDTFSYEVSACIDASGGMYLMGDTHLWYVKAGKPRALEPVDRSDIQPSEHKVTQRSTQWSLLRAYAKAIYDKGHSSGVDDGRQQERDYPTE